MEAAKPRRWNTAELQHAEIKQACKFAASLRELRGRVDIPSKPAHAYDVPTDRRQAHHMIEQFNIADLPFYKLIPFARWIEKSEVEFGS